jgi:hypothetical protein
MPVLCDYTQIIGDAAQVIPQTTGSAEVPLPDFNTDGRNANGPAPSRNGLLMLSARNLAGSARVLINGQDVGTITATPGTVFSTQMIALLADRLNAGDNKIALTDVSDTFELKNVVCFFHQSS